MSDTQSEIKSRCIYVCMCVLGFLCVSVCFVFSWGGGGGGGGRVCLLLFLLDFCFVLFCFGFVFVFWGEERGQAESSNWICSRKILDQWLFIMAQTGKGGGSRRELVPIDS